MTDTITLTLGDRAIVLTNNGRDIYEGDIGGGFRVEVVTFMARAEGRSRAAILDMSSPRWRAGVAIEEGPSAQEAFDRALAAARACVDADLSSARKHVDGLPEAIADLMAQADQRLERASRRASAAKEHLR